MTQTLITNCGNLVSGDIDHPLLPGDSILVADGKIIALGYRDSLPVAADAEIIDAGGQDAMPGLIDSHIHPVFGDWTPRLNIMGWLEAYLHAGITTAISQGSGPLPGYPSDREGMKALGILMARTCQNYRPGGLKVHGCAIALMEGFTRQDFEEMAAAGVWLIAEIGGSGGLVEPEAVRPMLALARECGFKSRVHFGPESIPGTKSIDARALAGMGADIVSHVNGGYTAASARDIQALIDDTDMVLEFTVTGNNRWLIDIARQARERGFLRRCHVGSDTPSAGGILPQGILRGIIFLASFADIPPAQAIALATGNSADAYGLNTGKLAVGREADILLMDAPLGSMAGNSLDAMRIGDIPGISMLMVDGEVIAWQTRNTLRTKRVARKIG